MLLKRFVANQRKYAVPVTVRQKDHGSADLLLVVRVVRRVGAADVPVPFAPTLEEAVLPDTARILAAMKELARY